MVRYWVIAPFRATRPDDFNKVWNHDLETGIISIGWEAVGSISDITREEVNSIIRKTYTKYSKTQSTRVTNMLWLFHKEILPGDIVIARRGRSVIAAIGEVESQATLSPGYSLRVKGVDYDHNRILRVKWQDKDRELEFPSMVFGMQTIYEIDKEKYESLISGDITKIEIESQDEAEDVTEFVLEKYLEEFIVSNFSRIFGTELKLYVDPVDNAVGQQINTDIGVIDLLAQDPDNGDFVVIELKKGRASDKVVGQTLRYMGWVKENLVTGSQKVRGIIICHEQDAKLSYAVKMVPEIFIKFYEISFSLRNAP